MKKYAIVLGLLFVLGITGIIMAFESTGAVEPDVVRINDLVMSFGQGSHQTESTTSYAATDIAEQLREIFTDMDSQRASRDAFLQVSLLIVFAVFMGGCALLLWGIHRRILAPFHKLERFAQNVAVGNLDIPLEMDKESSFGAFTESFDLMRVELARAREAERQANQSKRELVASLSHDIKTPVSSIKAVSELMAATSKEEKELQQLQTINTKADQIGILVSNLFSATLEELQELPVEPKELPSTILAELIKNADYRKKAVMENIPECLIIADDIRLAQVLDNIFENSYKYADTAIEVGASLKDNHLFLSISDNGKGVLSEELMLLCQKFYRGQNAQGKSGTGLGLYLSKYFLEKMAGELHCENGEGRFTVTLVMALA